MTRSHRPARKQRLVEMMVRVPADWKTRLNEMRGKQPLSDFVRDLIHSQIDTDRSRPLSPAPLIGRPPK